MEKEVKSKTDFLNNKIINKEIKILPYFKNKEKSKINNINSYVTNRKRNIKNTLKLNKNELSYSSKKNKNISNYKKKNILRTTLKVISKSHEKICLRKNQKKEISEDNIFLYKKYNINKNKKKILKIKEDQKTLKNKSKNSNTFRKIKINTLDISSNKYCKNSYNCKTMIAKKNLNDNKRNNSDIINMSLDDSIININKPKKSENIIFTNSLWRKSYFEPTNKIN